LVEDDLIAQRVHYLMLEELQYKVDCAASGEEAIAKCLNNYSLILMDCGLPDMSGFEASMEIRVLEKKHKIFARPIVMVSAYALNDEFEQQCSLAEIDKFISKPIGYEVLRDLLLAYT
jgi:CheY-like chemotaxis protein